MNIERMLAAAKWMLFIHNQGDHFDMRYYRNINNDNSSYKVLHKRGVRCCFAGWLSVSPQWISAGGTTINEGVPHYNDTSGSLAIARYLDITDAAARALIRPWEFNSLWVYEKDHDSVSALDVAAKLCKMVDEELDRQLRAA